MPVPSASRAVTPAVASLHARLTDVQEAIGVLRTTLVEDRPDEAPGRADNKALLDLVEAVDDLGDAVEAALAAPEAAGLQARAAAAVGVAHAHRALLVAGRLLRDQILPVGGRFDIARRAAARWGPAWQAWNRVAQTGLMDVAEALSVAEDAAADAVAALLDPLAPHSADADQEEALQ